MPSKGSKTKQGKPPERKQKSRTESSLGRKLRGRAWGLISAAATLLAFLVLWPRVIATIANPPSDPQNVFSASFSISNAGIIPLNHVNISILASYLNIPTAKNPIIVEMQNPDLGTGKQGVNFANPSWQDLRIDIGGSVTISPESQVVGKVSEADIVIRTSYEPPFIPVRFEKRFRFVARKDGSGNIYWRAWPLNKLAPPN